MNMRPFREYHLLQFLKSYENQTLPLDRYLSEYFRAHKSIGSSDRAEIAEAVYGMVRWQSLLDYLTEKPNNWEERWNLFQEFDPEDYENNESIPPHIRMSFPKVLFELITKTHGNEKGLELCKISNTQAPTTVRINSLKTTRDEMISLWKGQYEVEPCIQSQMGITFLKKINLWGLPEFKAGNFEVQDEASQLLANLVDVKPGQQVIDYCSGSGGKTLAFAPKMEHKGQIFLHDIRKGALIEAKKRLKRAGIQNAQVIESDSPHLSKLKKKMDWVLVDAPCTGTGTMRRNPDMKWKFTEETLTRLVGQQRHIFEKALSYLHPEGKIIYATCSLLKEENQNQIAHFTKTYDLEVVGEIFETLPSKHGMDGFFGVILKKI